MPLEPWPEPDYVESKWLDEPPKELRERVVTWVNDQGLDLTDRWLFSGAPPRFRRAQLPFYADVDLVEFAIERALDEGVLLGSFLVTAEPSPAAVWNRAARAEARTGAGEAGVWHLDGTSPPIHEVNATRSFAAENAEDAMAYLRFFCAHVWGEEGGFWVPQAADQIPWSASADPAQRESVGGKFQPPVFIGEEEDGWRFDATVLYAGSMFFANFEVMPTGMVEMLDDEPLATELPLRKDKRLQGFRVVTPED